MVRIINTDKLDEKYGIKGYTLPEKIDIFIDQENYSKYLVIEHYTDFEKGKMVPRQCILRFSDQIALNEYIKRNVSNYELTHNLPESEKRLHTHYVIFKNITYYFHEGHPDMNYLEFSYTEYKNSQQINDSIRLSGNYERMLIEALKESKKISGDLRSNSMYYRLIDVNRERKEQKAKNNRRKMEGIAFSVNEFCDMLQIGWNNNKKTIVSGLKLLGASLLTYIILSSGYTLVKDLFKKDAKFVNINMPTNTKTDSYVRKSLDRATNVIKSIIHNNKEELKREDLDFIVEYLKNLETINHDNNSSQAVFNYDEYFLPAIAEIKDDEYLNQYYRQEILKKINGMYKKCFIRDGKKLRTNKEACFDFFNYVSSLSYALDVEARDLPIEIMKFSKQYPGPGFASINEVRAYQSLPPVIRLIILTQLKGIENDMKFIFRDTPIYYFDKNNFGGITNSINKEYDKTISSMYEELRYRYRGKSM